LQTSLLFDPQWLDSSGAASGGLAIEVAPKGNRTVTFSAKQAGSPVETAVSLSSGGTMTLRIRPAGAEMPVAPTPPTTSDNPEPPPEP
jgi:hypothetical protein